MIKHMIVYMLYSACEYTKCKFIDSCVHIVYNISHINVRKPVAVINMLPKCTHQMHTIASRIALQHADQQASITKNYWYRSIGRSLCVVLITANIDLYTSMTTFGAYTLFLRPTKANWLCCKRKVKTHGVKQMWQNDYMLQKQNKESCWPYLPISLSFGLWCHGPLARHVLLRVGHAPGMPGTFSPPPTAKKTAI